MKKIVDYDHPSRAVRAPTQTEARQMLAIDLSRNKLKACGHDRAKAERIMWMPLFLVAMDGQHGMRLAERFAECERRAA